MRKTADSHFSPTVSHCSWRVRATFDALSAKKPYVFQWEWRTQEDLNL